MGFKISMSEPFFRGMGKISGLKLILMLTKSVTGKTIKISMVKINRHIKLAIIMVKITKHIKITIIMVKITKHIKIAYSLIEKLVKIL